MLIVSQVQRYNANPLSLISNHGTLIYVFTAAKIPPPPKSALAAAMPDKRDRGKSRLKNEHLHYVSHFYHEIDRDQAPEVEEFEQKAEMSLNVKDKFSLLQDVVEGKFCNLIVQLARDPYDFYDKVTLYVSDYTANDAFFNYTWANMGNVPGLGGDDPYGYSYTSSETTAPKKEWLGPYGQRAIQITCWEPHAGFIREEVRAGQWVYLRNVQIKHGANGQYLEGFMREERGLSTTNINVDVLDTIDRDTMDLRLKDAIRRWREYTKQKSKQIDEVKSAEVAGAKRRAAEPVAEAEQPKQKFNSKDRRKLKRAAVDKEKEEKRLDEETQIALNELVTCENHAQQISTVESILDPELYRITINDEPKEAAVPFSCANYRARTRVVDFYPRKLEDFACSRVTTPFDVLSDTTNPASDGSFSDDGQGAISRGFSRVWEWRFALELQDAVPRKGNDDGPRKTLWAVVDNLEGQCLTGLDASNLHEETDNLAQLRERLFTLWGNLEEYKENKAKSNKNETRRGAGVRGKLPQIERPPLDSSDGEDNGEESSAPAGSNFISNNPFYCCIRQHGLRVTKGDDLPTVVDNNPDEDWMRVYSLFGTKICS